MTFCSFTSPVPCHQQLINQGGIEPRICSFFDWNIGKDRPQPKCHDIDLPFPTSQLKTTFLDGRELRCCCRATTDGFSATDFHDYCDFKGPASRLDTTMATSNLAHSTWKDTEVLMTTMIRFDAFLFYWKDAETNGVPATLPKVGGSGAALFDYMRGDPQFGADGLLISLPLAPVMVGFARQDTNSGVSDLRQAKSRLGLSYAKREGVHLWRGVQGCTAGGFSVLESSDGELVLNCRRRWRFSKSNVRTFLNRTD